MCIHIFEEILIHNVKITHSHTHSKVYNSIFIWLHPVCYPKVWRNWPCKRFLTLTLLTFAKEFLVCCLSSCSSRVLLMKCGSKTLYYFRFMHGVQFLLPCEQGLEYVNRFTCMMPVPKMGQLQSGYLQVWVSILFDASVSSTHFYSFWRECKLP